MVADINHHLTEDTSHLGQRLQSHHHQELQVRRPPSPLLRRTRTLPHGTTHLTSGWRSVRRGEEHPVLCSSRLPLLSQISLPLVDRQAQSMRHIPFSKELLRPCHRRQKLGQLGSRHHRRWLIHRSNEGLHRRLQTPTRLQRPQQHILSLNNRLYPEDRPRTIHLQLQPLHQAVMRLLQAPKLFLTAVLGRLHRGRAYCLLPDHTHHMVLPDMVNLRDLHLRHLLRHRRRLKPHHQRHSRLLRAEGKAHYRTL